MPQTLDESGLFHNSGNLLILRDNTDKDDGESNSSGAGTAARPLSVNCLKYRCRFKLWAILLNEANRSVPLKLLRRASDNSGSQINGGYIDWSLRFHN